MKSITSFIVEIEQPIKDKIQTSSGVELFIDTRFNEFQYRTTSGKIIAVPSILSNKRNDTDQHGASFVKPGDTLYFHHLVVMDKTQALVGVDNHFMVKYDPVHTLNNQAIAYKDQDTGEIIPLFGWCLLSPAPKEEPEEGVIKIVKIKEEPETLGVVAKMCDELKDVNLKIGDVVGFAKGMDYRIDIDGVELYRTRIQDLLYVKEKS
jgi:co-chaperonin GroES (HSP10)